MIQPGALGFDSLNDPAPPARLAADGVKFRTFYIAQRSAYPGKITDADAGYEQDRIRAHIDAGVGVLLNFEAAADRWTGGASAGATDGAWSRKVCTALGYPDGLPVLISYDTDISAATLPTAVAYGVAFDGTLGARWPIGVYGEQSIMAALDGLGICKMCWHVMAHSWDNAPGGRAPIHVEQRRPTAAETARMPYFTRSALDANDAVRPFPVWLPHPDPPPPPPGPPVVHPTPIPMDPNEESDVEKFLVRAQSGQMYVTDMVSYAHPCSEPEGERLRDVRGCKVDKDSGPFGLDDLDSGYIERIAAQPT